jgi:hypothetical protein
MRQRIRKLFQTAIAIAVASVAVAVSATPARAAEAWINWQPIPGISVFSAPAVVTFVHPSTFRPQLWAFAADTSGVLWVNRYNGSFWSGWSAEFGTFRGALVSAGMGSNGLPVVFGMSGTGGTLRFNQADFGGWRGWMDVLPAADPFLITPPAVTRAFGGGALMFAMGWPGRVVMNRYVTPNFDGWSDLPGAVTMGQPAATTDQFATSVYIRGNNNLVKVNRSPGGGPFTGWSDLPGGFGVTNDDPAVTTSTGTNPQTYVFVRSALAGHGDEIYLASRPASSSPPAFSTWRVHPGGGRTNSAPRATTWNGLPVVFVAGLDRQVYWTRLIQP